MSLKKNAQLDLDKKSSLSQSWTKNGCHGLKKKNLINNPEHMQAFEWLLSLEKILAEQFVGKKFQGIDIEEYPSIQSSLDILLTFEIMW